MYRDRFCARPFVHSLVETDGKFRPCCRAVPVTNFTGRTDYNINNDSVDDWWNSDYMNHLRTNMINNVESPECERCYRQEDLGSRSFRQDSNTEFGRCKVPKSVPDDWEFQITNLCNLKCMMCSSQNSSQLLNENVILFGEKTSQSRFQWNDNSQQKIKDLFDGKLTSAVIRGGEPFMVPWVKDLLSSVSAERASHIVLLFNTNLTKLDRSWIPILKKFNQVRVSCSIDAVGALNEYIRFPSDWKQIQDTVKLVKVIPKSEYFINTCVQNLNVLHLDRLLIWAKQNQMYVILDALTEPAIYELTNLPPELIGIAINRLETIMPKLDKSIVRGVDGIVKALYNASYSEDHWQEFIAIVNKRDQHRGVSVLDVNPEFKDYWHAT